MVLHVGDCVEAVSHFITDDSVLFRIEIEPRRRGVVQQIDGLTAVIQFDNAIRTNKVSTKEGYGNKLQVVESLVVAVPSATIGASEDAYAQARVDTRPVVELQWLIMDLPGFHRLLGGCHSIIVMKVADTSSSHTYALEKKQRCLQNICQCKNKFDTSLFKHGVHISHWNMMEKRLTDASCVLKVFRRLDTARHSRSDSLTAAWEAAAQYPFHISKSNCHHAALNVFNKFAPSPISQDQMPNAVLSSLGGVAASLWGVSGSVDTISASGDSESGGFLMAATAAAGGGALLIFGPPVASGLASACAGQSLLAGGIAGMTCTVKSTSTSDDFDWEEFCKSVVSAGGVAFLVNAAGFAAGYGAARLVMTKDLASKMSAPALKSICMGAGAVAGSTTSVTCIKIRRWSEGKEVQTFELLVAGCAGALSGSVAGKAGAYAAELHSTNFVNVEVVDKSCQPRNPISCADQRGNVTFYACDEPLNGLAPYQRLLSEHPADKILFLESHGSQCGKDAFSQLCEGCDPQSYLGNVGGTPWPDWMHKCQEMARCGIQHPGTRVVDLADLAEELNVIGKGVSEGSKKLIEYVQKEGYTRVALTTCWGSKSIVLESLVGHCNIDLIVGQDAVAQVGIAQGLVGAAMARSGVKEVD